MGLTIIAPKIHLKSASTTGQFDLRFNRNLIIPKNLQKTDYSTSIEISIEFAEFEYEIVQGTWITEKESTKLMDDLKK